MLLLQGPVSFAATANEGHHNHSTGTAPAMLPFVSLWLLPLTLLCQATEHPACYTQTTNKAPTLLPCLAKPLLATINRICNMTILSPALLQLQLLPFIWNATASAHLFGCCRQSAFTTCS
jgi:hypothetical protein